MARLRDAWGAGLALVSMTEEKPTGWNIENALVDGILLSGTGRVFLVGVTQRSGLSFVSLSLDANEPDVPGISVDDFDEARAAARRGVNLGLRQFTVLAFALGDGPGRVRPEEVRATRSMKVRGGAALPGRCRTRRAAILDDAMPEGREVLLLGLAGRGSTGPAPA